MKYLVSVLVILSFSIGAMAEWKIDFSRRMSEIKKPEEMVRKQPKESLFDFVFASGEPVQNIVVLNTDRGFLPSSVRVREGAAYKIHVVNVNENEKNVSFVLDAFSQHHATYYGKIKSFHIKPRKEGIYSFQCPETSAQGRLVVYPSARPQPPQIQPSIELRAPASE